MAGNSELSATGLSEIITNIEKFKSVHALTVATVGALLTDCKKDKLYKKRAVHITKWHEFLKDIDFPYSKAKTYMDIWKYYGEAILNKEVDVEKLIKTLPILRKGGDPAEWLEKAIFLSQQDFNNEIYKTRGKKDSTICDHSKTKEWHKCEDCGAWIPGE